MARLLAEHQDVFAVDEFTSIVDRNVARIGSAAIAKTVRRRKQRLIIASCHSDILEWLQPDWVLTPLDGKLLTPELLRPRIDIVIRKCSRNEWNRFRRFHYLDTHIHRAAYCWLGTWNDVPVSFASVLSMPHPAE